MPTVISNINNREFKWTFDANGSISLGENYYQADIQKISPQRYSILLNGKSFQVVVARNKFMYSILINGNICKVEVETSARKLINFGDGAGKGNRAYLEIRSPMPGMVVRCEVEEGSEIKAGDGLLILEAMKMENEIRATRNGIIKKILVREKQVVDKGELLITME
jgi:acetyl/propionyl-CoA carboxylase alpha subunit